jgi:cadmium resistance protein CadD (predicted permease)
LPILQWNWDGADRGRPIGRTRSHFFRHQAKALGIAGRMSSVISVLAASVTTFAATNLDDIFLLTVFFARRVPTRRIVAGQYLGFATIVALSFALVWGVSLAIPRAWTRLLGILPLAIGIKELVRIRRSQAIPAERVDSSVSVLSIATITLANGADNVGVYVPFFVAHRADLQLVLVVYGLLVLVWCSVGKWFGRHALALKALAGWGHWIVPFVLIGLGGYILLCG